MHVEDPLTVRVLGNYYPPASTRTYPEIASLNNPSGQTSDKKRLPWRIAIDPPSIPPIYQKTGNGGMVHRLGFGNPVYN